MEITLSREVKSYLLENYLPSTLFVSMSWGSFVVVPEIVPGRMVLLVTTLLSLITMFDTVRNNSPDALELKCLEVVSIMLAKCQQIGIKLSHQHQSWLLIFVNAFVYFVTVISSRYSCLQLDFLVYKSFKRTTKQYRS